MTDPDRPEGRKQGVSAGSEAMAIVGMACRFPGADDLFAFWRMLEEGKSGVIEGVPGSGVGRIGELFAEGEGRAPACRFGAYLDELDRFDARLLSHLAGGSAVSRPPAANDAGNLLARTGGMPASTPTT